MDKDVTVHLLRVLVAVNMEKEKDVLVVGEQREKLWLAKELGLRRNVLGV